MTERSASQHDVELKVPPPVVSDERQKVPRPSDRRRTWRLSGESGCEEVTQTLFTSYLRIFWQFVSDRSVLLAAQEAH